MKRYSIAKKVMLMITITALLLGTVIITAGAIMIYNAKEDSIRSEVKTATHTFLNLYNSSYSGELRYEGDNVYAGDKEIITSDFMDILHIVKYDEDIDFTLFMGDTRIFTSVTNKDGSYAVGTKASEEVVATVINGGNESFFPRVLVNGKYFLGCYMPIKSSDGKVQGMVFAGKPIDDAETIAVDAVSKFIILAVITLVVALSVCLLGLKGIADNIADIKQFLGTLANGDFSARMDEKTLNRNDEIGELAKNMIKVQTNLKDMVELDPLTSLLNRRSCKLRLEALNDSKTPYTIVMADVDYFKKINDTYGHSAGDYVLKEFSALLEVSADKRGGFVSRWGGEEFLMTFPESDLNNTKQLIDGLLDEIRIKEFTVEDNRFNLTMTFGIAESQENEPYELTINRADELLYKGKAAGRNRVMI